MSNARPKGYKHLNKSKLFISLARVAEFGLAQPQLVSYFFLKTDRQTDQQSLT